MSLIDLIKPEMIATIIGGFISLFTAIFILKQEERSGIEKLRGERLDADRRIALTLYFKIIEVYDSISKINSHFFNGMNEANVSKSVLNPWTTVLPLVGVFPSVSFTPEEKNFLFHLKNNDLLNDIISLDSANSTYIMLVNEYNQKRSELSKLLVNSKTEVNFNRLDTIVEQKDKPALIPHIEYCNSIIRNILIDCPLILHQVKSSIHRYVDIINVKYKVGVAVELP